MMDVVKKINTIKLVSFLAQRIWDILPKNLHDSETLDIFKAKFEKWVVREIPCGPLKTYVLQKRISE